MAYNEKRVCPYCADEHCEADWTDVGVGLVQTGPYHCYCCGATEIGPFDTSGPTPEESTIGWYAPNSANLPDTVSTLDGKFIDAKTALDWYRKGLVPCAPFRLTSDLLAVVQG